MKASPAIGTALFAAGILSYACAGPTPSLKVEVEGTTASPTIPPTFASFSFEQGHVAPLRDTDGKPCKIYLQLLANLAKASGLGMNQSRLVRIGGNSQE